MINKSNWYLHIILFVLNINNKKIKLTVSYYYRGKWHGQITTIYYILYFYKTKSRLHYLLTILNNFKCR